MPLVKTLLRCAGSSLAGVTLEFALLTLLVSVCRVHYVVAALSASGVSLFLSFVLNRLWAFRAGGSAWRQLLRHALVTGTGVLLGTPLLWVLVHGVGLPYQAGWAAAGVLSFFAWTFPMQRWFTYRRVVPATCCS